jgi:hypothetical protein
MQVASASGVRRIGEACAMAAPTSVWQRLSSGPPFGAAILEATRYASAKFDCRKEFPMRTTLRSILVISMVLGSLPALAADSKDVDATPQARVYRASEKAIASGDVKAYQATLASESVKEMEKVSREMGKTPKDLMELVKIMQPVNVKLSDLKVDGKTATMSAEGKSENETMYGTIELADENGQWKVRKQKWSNTKK